jgi:malonate decarboxylase epsilon subunit
VANKLQERISAMSIRTPGAIYVGNINARPLRKKEQVSNDLANNIAHGVRWHDATTVLKELGCSLFLEMPPGHVLSNLAQENLSDVKSVPVESSSLSKILHLARSSR